MSGNNFPKKGSHSLLDLFQREERGVALHVDAIIGVDHLQAQLLPHLCLLLIDPLLLPPLLGQHGRMQRRELRIKFLILIHL